MKQAGFDIIKTFVPASSDMPEVSWPDPVEHARVFVTETFPGDIATAFEICCLNIEASPLQAAYWAIVADACLAWGMELERAKA